jgi:hypothetical protein
MSPIVRAISIQVAAAALTVAGCGGGDQVPREAVSGSVTLDGQPLPDGQITFVPETGQNAAAATIGNGSYSIKRSEGPSPGAHRVMVTRQIPTGKKVPSDPEVPGSELVDQRRESIPPRFNQKTELKADVQKGGANRFDYALTSQETPKGK